MNESEYTEPDSPFGGAQEPSESPQPEAEAGGKAFDFWGLRNSQPAVSPSEIGYQMDLQADWWEHLFCGFLKQSGSEAAEAWQHYVISLILLADREYGLLSDDEREELEETDTFEDLE
jgi:hypothetical protein